MATAAVFGSSEPLPGEPAYEQARELGQGLARAGWRVATGGYGGVMEAASRGAREAGGRTLGVTCEIFDSRSHNRFLDEVQSTRDLHERTQTLIDCAQAFVVVPGKAGTLAELSFLWALHRAGCLDRTPVVLLGDVWRGLTEALGGLQLLDRSQIELHRIVDRTEDAVSALGAPPPPGEADGVLP